MEGTTQQYWMVHVVFFCGSDYGSCMTYLRRREQDERKVSQRRAIAYHGEHSGTSTLTRVRIKLTSLVCSSELKRQISQLTLMTLPGFPTKASPQRIIRSFQTCEIQIILSSVHHVLARITVNPDESLEGTSTRSKPHLLALPSTYSLAHPNFSPGETFSRLISARICLDQA